MQPLEEAREAFSWAQKAFQESADILIGTLFHELKLWLNLVWFCQWILQVCIEKSPAAVLVSVYNSVTQNSEPVCRAQLKVRSWIFFRMHHNENVL